MRFFIVICLFFAVGCNNPGTKKSGSGSNATNQENFKTVALELSIQGMTCTGCEQTIQAGVAGIKGVKQVKATFVNGKAFVEYVPNLTDTTQIKEKIMASGYIVAQIKPIPIDTLRAKIVN